MILDYNKPITRDNIDIDKYNNKFKRVETWLKSDMRDSKEYVELLKDKTTFSYLHLRIDGKPIKLYSYQDMIINDIHDRIYFRAANQIGKSILLDVKAAINLLWDHGHAHNEAIVSKSLPQSIYQMRRIKGLLTTMPELSWKDIQGSSDSMSVVSVDIKDINGKLKYSNMLICAPCTEGVLGYDLHDLNLDEFEFWDVDLQYFYTQLAQPRTYATKGKIWVFSNPNGVTSYGNVLENQTRLDGSKRWHVYVFNYLDKPGNTIDEYNQLKHELSRMSFESTVAAIRSIGSNTYFTYEEVIRSYSQELNELSMVGKQLYAFLDVGSKHDQSVLVMGYVEVDPEKQLGGRELYHLYVPIIHVYPIGYPLSRVVGVNNVPESDGWHYEKSVREHLDEWTINGLSPIFGVDITGNSGISPLFETVGIEPIDVTFSGPVKSGMYQRFKYYMEKGLLHRVKSEEFEYQCSRLVMRKSERKYLIVHHETEDDRDDVPDSIAGLIHISDNYTETEVSIKSFG